MQRMHQSYKIMKAQKETKRCASNSLAHEDLGHFEEAHRWNIQAEFYNENSHQYMKVTIQETLYHEDHGATLKHKCGKRIVAFSLISFSLFLIWAFSPFLWPLLFSFFLFSSGVSSRLVGESQSPSSFPHWDNALIMMTITLLFFLQLKNYNSILRTRYDSI